MLRRLLALLPAMLVAPVAFPALNHAQEPGVKPLRVAVPYLPQTLDPLALDEPVSRILLQNLCGSLVLRTRAEVAPLSLAASSSAYERGQRWSFELIPGIAFSNGRTLSAKAVRDSLEIYRVQFEREASALSSPVFAAVRALGNAAQITAHDPVAADALPKVEILLKSPDPGFARSAATLGLLDTELMGAFGEAFGRGTHFAGAGSYQIRERRDDALDLEGVPAPGSGVLPRAQLVRFTVYNGFDQVQRRLRSAEIDIILFVTPKIEQQLHDDNAVRVIPSPLLLLGDSEQWRPKQRFWGAEAPENELQVGKMLLRKDLELDDGFKERFELKGVYDRISPPAVPSAVK